MISLGTLKIRGKCILFFSVILLGRKKKKTGRERSRNRSKSLSSRSLSLSPPRGILSAPPPLDPKTCIMTLGFVHEVDRSTEDISNDHAPSPRCPLFSGRILIYRKSRFRVVLRIRRSEEFISNRPNVNRINWERP